MPDKRFLTIKKIIDRYSKGNFEVTDIDSFKKSDDIDDILKALLLMGKDLEKATISRDFFSSIYNTVTDMLFIVNNKGEILDVNLTTEKSLGFKVKGEIFFSICKNNKPGINFKTLKERLSIFEKPSKFETVFNSINNDQIYVSCSVSPLSQNDSQERFLIVAEDITLKKLADNKIFRTVLETQENERKRVANDLHDSIGQELSSIKMMLGVVRKKIKKPGKKQIVSSTIDILEDSIQNLRDICFNLMPNVLDKGGLVYAIQQLIEKTSAIRVEFSSNVEEINIEKVAQISVYRVIQEFINNTTKHSKADLINIDIRQTRKKLTITLYDDGIGFNLKKSNNNKGRGLNTMRSRVETFGGKFVLLSKEGVGTKAKIIFI